MPCLNKLVYHLFAKDAFSPCTALLDDLSVFLLECQEGDESCWLKCNFISSNHLHKIFRKWILCTELSDTNEKSRAPIHYWVWWKISRLKSRKVMKYELLNITFSPIMCHIFMQKLSWIAFVDLIFRSFFAELPKCYCTRKKLN